MWLDNIVFVRAHNPCWARPPVPMPQQVWKAIPTWAMCLPCKKKTIILNRTFKPNPKRPQQLFAHGKCMTCRRNVVCIQSMKTKAPPDFTLKSIRQFAQTVFLKAGANLASLWAFFQVSLNQCGQPDANYGEWFAFLLLLDIICFAFEVIPMHQLNVIAMYDTYLTELPKVLLMAIALYYPRGDGLSIFSPEESVSFALALSFLFGAEDHVNWLIEKAKKKLDETLDFDKPADTDKDK